MWGLRLDEWQKNPSWLDLASHLRIPHTLLLTFLNTSREIFSLPPHWMVGDWQGYAVLACGTQWATLLWYSLSIMVQFWHVHTQWTALLWYSLSIVTTRSLFRPLVMLHKHTFLHPTSIPLPPSKSPIQCLMTWHGALVTHVHSLEKALLWFYIPSVQSMYMYM